MKKTYKVEVTNGDRLYTAYEGKSRDMAAKIADAVRTALIIGKGSGAVTLRQNNIADVVFSLNNGEAFLSLIGGADAHNRRAAG